MNPALILLALIALPLQAQKGVRVTLQTIINGTEVRGGDGSMNRTDGSTVVIIHSVSERPDALTLSHAYIDLKGRNISSLPTCLTVTVMATVTPFSSLPSPEERGEYGDDCRVPVQEARVVYFSNTIDIWYTTEAGVAVPPCRHTDCLMAWYESSTQRKSCN